MKYNEFSDKIAYFQICIKVPSSGGRFCSNFLRNAMKCSFYIY